MTDTTWIPAMEIVSLGCDDPHWNFQLVSTVPCLNLRVHSQSLGTPQQRHQTEAVSSLNGLAFMSATTYWTLDRAAEWHMRHVSLKTPAMLWVPTGRAPCQAFSGCLQSGQTPADKVKRWTERWAGESQLGQNIRWVVKQKGEWSGGTVCRHRHQVPVTGCSVFFQYVPLTAPT